MGGFMIRSGGSGIPWLLVCLIPWLATIGCASTGDTALQIFRSEPTTEPAWQLPASSFPSQRLYRIQYDGPEGNVGLRLTLYLAGTHHYRMDAADSLGRRVWSLAVEPGDRAIWLDHRKKVFCRVYAASEQAFVPIAQLPLVSLPNLMLGRLPEVPASELSEGEGKISYRDAKGRTWNAQGNELGDLTWWSMLEGGEPVAWWRVVEGQHVFSDRRGGQQVRWTEQIREPLQTPLRPLEVPAAYREGACGAQLSSSAS